MTRDPVDVHANPTPNDLGLKSYLINEEDIGVLYAYLRCSLYIAARSIVGLSLFWSLWQVSDICSDALNHVQHSSMARPRQLLTNDRRPDGVFGGASVNNGWG